jgi:hypothetical protein
MVMLQNFTLSLEPIVEVVTVARTSRQPEFMGPFLDLLAQAWIAR